MNNKLRPSSGPPAVPRKPVIGVILGSSRQGRLSEVPAQWIYGLAGRRHDLQAELIDVGNHPLPFFHAAVASQPRDAVHAKLVQRWCTALERLDGFIVVVPGDDALRIACPSAEAGPERTAFLHKPVGFVGYGKLAVMPNVHALRSLASTLQMAPMSRELHLTIHEAMSVWKIDQGIEDYPHLTRSAHHMLDELSWWTHALREARHRAVMHAQGALRPAAPLSLLRRAGQLVHHWARRPQVECADLSALPLRR